MTVIRNSRERTPSSVPAPIAAVCALCCATLSPGARSVIVELAWRSIDSTLSGSPTTASPASGFSNSSTVPASTPLVESRRICSASTTVARRVRGTDPGRSSSTEMRRRLPHAPGSRACTCEQRISFNESRPFGMREVEWTIELYLGGSRGGRCVGCEAMEEGIATGCSHSHNGVGPEARAVGDQQRSGTGRGRKGERSGLDWSGSGSILSPYICASRMTSDEWTREDYVAGIGARCGAVWNRSNSDELVIRRIADANDVAGREAHAIEQINDDRSSRGRGCQSLQAEEGHDVIARVVDIGECRGQSDGVWRRGG